MKQSGSNQKTNCPWHHDKTPSLYFYPDGHFFCFSCHRTGDAVGFYAAYFSLTPLKAAQKLAGDFGLEASDVQSEAYSQHHSKPKQYDAHDLMLALEVYQREERARLTCNIRLAEQAIALAEDLLGSPDACWESDVFCWLLKNREQQKEDRDLLDTATMGELFYGARGGDAD